ncbi:transcriptional regulator [Candidatus Amarolinea dominans]|uniref:helix-turn-helix domain-containing protein n=1 Tax=Candidatus Amarolinea dominans TaxID=3140696 RepID=UPI0031CC6E95
MALKPIRNDEDYHAALQEIEQLWDAEPGTPESDTLDILVTLVEAYEKGSLRLAVARSYRRAGVFHGEPRLDTQAVGTVPRSRGRVSEILGRKRPLTLPMIRRLEQVTGIPGSVLIRSYPTEQDNLELPARKTPIARSTSKMVAAVHQALNEMQSRAYHA